MQSTAGQAGGGQPRQATSWIFGELEGADAAVTINGLTIGFDQSQLDISATRRGAGEQA